jgi:hypothetical protein
MDAESIGLKPGAVATYQYEEVEAETESGETPYNELESITENLEDAAAVGA